MYNIFRILIGVPDYSSSSLFLNEEEAIPPQEFRITVVVVSFWMKTKLSPPPPDKQNTPGILYIPPPPDKHNTPGIYIGIPSTCTEDVQYI